MKKLITMVSVPVVLLSIVTASLAAKMPVKSTIQTTQTDTILLKIDKQLANLNDQIADMNRQMHMLVQIESTRG